MSSRSMKGRLDKLAARQVPPAGAECRFHGTECQMGARWPAPRPVHPVDEFIDMIREAKLSDGQPVGPHPRDVWATDRHERVPDAEIRERAAELAELIAEAEAENEVMYAAIVAQGEAERRDRPAVPTKFSKLLDGPQ